MNRILSVVFILLLTCINSIAQQVPNGSFESWSGNEPDNWNTTNQSVLGVDFSTVTKDVSGPQQGTASAKLTVVTKTIGFPINQTVTLPGVLTLGILKIDPVAQTASITGGYPFTGKPQKLTGYFKYQPVNNDTCAMGWGLTKWNNGTRDTIGYGAIRKMGTINTWTYFEIPLTYKLSEAPDTINMLFINSNPLDGIVHTGSTMWIDNLTFVYSGLGIEGLVFSKELNMYAAPDSKQLILSTKFTKPENLDIRLFNMEGIESRHWQRTMYQSSEYLDINNLSPGTYVIRITSGNRLVDSRKITILN